MTGASLFSATARTTFSILKILFICGSLEPGRDGVGDYVRRLASACQTRGHVCALLALHDPHIALRSEEVWAGLPILRLRANAFWPDRLATAQTFLERHAPDVVSWQLVPYAFHPRGFLPAALLVSAPGLRGPRSHVMAHELWLGLEKGAGWYPRAVGWLQRRGVRCLLAQLNPDVIHTSNAAYAHALAGDGWHAQLLPLFGNVPIAPPLTDARSALAAWLPATTKVSPLVVVTFGTLHAQWQPLACVQWLRATAHRHGRAPVLLAVGRTGGHADAILQVFRRAGVLVVATGELAPTALSHVLSAADCGIAPHPWALIGKSGAAAAMLEHGLPVLVPRDDWKLRDHGPSSAPPDALDPLLVRLAGLDAARTDAWLAARRTPHSGLARTTDDFLAALIPPAPAHP